MKISVIIPTLNEADNIKDAIDSVGGRAEVIVADGGSSDDTRRIAASVGARIVDSPPGRGLQMDRAASIASGDILLFLHADTRLPPGWFEAICGCMEDRDVVAGAFSLRIDSPRRWFRLVEYMIVVRSRWLGLIYGDQSVFVRKDIFLKTGGFRNLPLMEDVDCVKRLRKVGKIRLLRHRVTTSARRWEREGRYRNTLRNWLLLTLYYLGLSPDRLYRWYYGRKAYE